MFKPNRWTVTAYWANPPVEDMPPYSSRTWAYYRKAEATDMAEYLFAHTARFIYVRAWEGKTGKLVQQMVAP
jgi:hypothetical protein